MHIGVEGAMAHRDTGLGDPEHLFQRRVVRRSEQVVHPDTGAVFEFPEGVS